MASRLLPMVAAVVVAGGTILPGVAVAEPEREVSLADSPTLSLRTVGVDSTISLYGIEGRQTLSLPVQPGLVPTELVATLALPVNAAGGTLEVSQDERIISRVPLPSDQAPITIPLAGARIVDSAVTILLRSYLTVPDGYCVFDASNPLRLVGTEIRYSGQELAPTTVADFLPPVLQRLTLAVPSNPSRAESDAAAHLATATVARYGPQRTEIDIISADGVLSPPVPLERQIVIREGDAPGVRLDGPNAVPALLIAGSPADLANQARLLSSDLSELAVQSSAVAGPLAVVPQLPSDRTTIRRLGQPGVNATDLVNPRVTVPLDQTRIGRSVAGVRVHLQGSYTPLPAGLAGQVTVSVAGEMLARWATEPSGQIDRWIDIPERLLERYINLDIAVDAAGNTGRCGEFQPITLTVDGETAVETERASPPIPGGFQSLPQALMPRIEVGLDEGFDNLRRAVRIVTGLQRLSGLPFDTAVVSREDAIGSGNPAIVVSPDGWNDDRIALPVTVDADGVITVENVDGAGTSSTLTLDPAVGFGSLQTLYTGGRTLLVATSSNAPAELDRLLTWLDSDVNRWSALTGDAVVSMPGREPIELTTPASAVATAAATTDRKNLYLAIGVGSLALVGLGAALIVLRGRRSRGEQ
ncbi:cellulose biosynthesis cyclic di-GMP-binding regulatory protein BcsB [Mycolicibacterium sp. P9-22]|uniref:cellulose biosynthesis cyclic di-GMP-binding regulatory protein BcsB n=1 Tax=Mycolicibacterium sp. P9-22 TaxID=2024613 RepID=UPI001D13AEE2|nr:cellulose biosynthesis cyclic di-GMP-binding regulatory protein BcsB [Mycolicibacterium sp. P9-22]